MPLNFDSERDQAGAGPLEPRSNPAYVIACLAAAGAALLSSAVLFAARHGGERRPAEILPPLRGSDAPTAAALPTPAKPAAITPPKRTSRPPARPDPNAGFLANLRAASPGVVTLRVEDAPAARAEAGRLAALFRAAGWRVEVEAERSFGAAEPMIGLAAALGDTPQDEAIERAFAATGASLSPPPLAGLFRTPVLLVGLPPG